MQTADEILTLPERLVPPLDRGQRAFRVALVVAVLLHAALFIEAGRSVPRTMGDRSGSDDAIAVEIVTAADLKSRETVSSPPAGVQAPPPAPPPQPEVQPQPEPPPPEPVPEPAPEAVAPTPPPTPAEPAPKQEEQKPPEDKPQDKPVEEKSALPDFESLLPDLATIPQPTDDPPKKAEAAKKAAEPQEAAKPAEKSPPAKKKPAQKQARLDPRSQDLSSAPPGRSAAATRPPGITRSGENDDFGRNVIRALRQTMPPPRGIFGRVTIRLILNENGDLAQVQVLDPSGTSIDQDVQFAVKQSYFPLPPYNSTVADRTFIITYVYR
jgi:TonB family protein